MLASHVRSFMLTQLRSALGAAPVQAASLGASLPSERVCVPTQALVMHCQGFCAARLEQLAYYTALGAPPAGCPLEALCVYLNALNGLAAQHQAQGTGCDEQKCEGTSSGVLDCVHASEASGWLDGEEEARDGGRQSLGARLSVCFQ